MTCLLAVEVLEGQSCQNFKMCHKAKGALHCLLHDGCVLRSQACILCLRDLLAIHANSLSDALDVRTVRYKAHV